MNKDEILSKSRKENLDEREQCIEKSANENSYRAVIVVFAILSIILLAQELLTGKAFADYRVFSLALLIGMIGQSATVYYYDRHRKGYLVCAILEMLGAISCLALIIATGMEWL